MNDVSNATVRKMRRQVLAEGLVDWVSLPLLVGMTREMDPTADDERMRHIVLTTIQELLTEGLVVVGTLKTDLSEVAAWPTNVSGSIDRLASEWAFLRHSATRVMDAWLENTPAGDEAARGTKGQ